MSADPKARPLWVGDLLAALTAEYLSSPVYAGEQGTDNERFPVIGVTSLGQEPGVVIEISGDPYVERQEQEARIEELEDKIRAIRELVSGFSGEHMPDPEETAEPQEDVPPVPDPPALKTFKDATKALFDKIGDVVEGAEV